MSEEPNEEQQQEEEGTLPPESKPQGASSLEKGDVEWGEHGGKGGDHPTPGAGEHDHPNG